MSAIKNEKGNKYGRLTIIKEAGRNKNGQVVWECKCECGKHIIASGVLIRRGGVKSCGCLVADGTSRPNITHHCSRADSIHKRLYKIWAGMRSRCLSQSNPAFPDYGARGIDICEEWMDFKNFRDWALFNGYSSTLTIDRINNDAGYSPANCRFITLAENQRNRRNNRRIAYDGQEMILCEWAEVLGIESRTLQRRLAIGWDVHEAFTRPVRRFMGIPERELKNIGDKITISPDSWEE